MNDEERKAKEELDRKIETKGRALVLSLVAELWTPADAGHLPHAELVSVGMERVCALAPRWDATLEVQFTTFLYPWVRGALLDALERSRTTSAIERALNHEARAFSSTLSDRFDIWNDDDATVRSRLQAVADRVAASLHATTKAIAQRSGAEEDAVIDALDAERDHAAFRALLSRLPEKLRFVWPELYLAGRSLDDVASAYGISKSTVQRRKNEFIEEVSAAFRGRT